MQLPGRRWREQDPLVGAFRVRIQEVETTQAEAHAKLYVLEAELLSNLAKLCAVELGASVQPIDDPSVNRFGDPEMIIGSEEPVGVRRSRAERLGAGERFAAAGTLPCSATMFA